MRLTARRSALITCTWSGLVLGAICLFEYQAGHAHKFFANAAYLTASQDIAKTVTLVNGQGVVWEQLAHVSLYYEGHYVYGDWNHDGLKDAAVVIGESQGGSDDEVFLAFLIHDGTRLVHRHSAYLGDSAIIRSVKAHGDQVIVDMFIHQEGDCQAGPTKHVKHVYGYDDAFLVKLPSPADSSVSKIPYRTRG
jgi:hypothetical protein